MTLSEFILLSDIYNRVWNVFRNYADAINLGSNVNKDISRTLIDFANLYDIFTLNFSLKYILEGISIIPVLLDASSNNNPISLEATSSTPLLIAASSENAPIELEVSSIKPTLLTAGS
jgi:hypothetical protein